MQSNLKGAALVCHFEGIFVCFGSYDKYRSFPLMSITAHEIIENDHTASPLHNLIQLF